LVPLVTTVLESDYPLVRYFAKRAAEKLAHEPVPVDPGAPRADIERGIRAWNQARTAPSDAKN
jgi:hypothetical protein